MPTTANLCEASQNKPPWKALAVLIAGLFLLQLGCYFAGLIVPPGELVDADGYSRLVRVGHLADTGNWFDSVMPRSNPMVPETSQWCRWIDLALLAGGKLFEIVLGPEKGLFAWAVIFSPFLLACCGAAFAWAGVPLVPIRHAFLTVLLLYIQPGILIYLAAGRPDHHGVLLLLLILVVGCLIRALAGGPQAPRWAAAAGIAQGLALTISIEALIACLLGLVATGAVWLLGRNDGLRVARHHATALLATAVCGVACTIPVSEWNLTETDRLAPPYLIALATVALFWIGLRFFPATTRFHSRFWIGIAGATLSVSVTLIIAPALLQHPQLAWDPRIGELWVSSVREYHPLAHGWRNWPAALLIWVGPAVVVLPILALQLSKGRHNLLALLPQAFLFSGTLVFGVLTILQIRWCTYFEVFVILPWASLLVSALQSLENRQNGGNQSLRTTASRVGLILAFTLGFPLAGLVVRTLTLPPSTPLPPAAASAPPPSGSSLSTPEKADLRSLSNWLNNPEWELSGPETILTLLDFGPELLYRTPHHVIATPNHRNADGILYLYDTFKAPSSESRERLERKRITLIVLCPGSHEAQFYNQENPADSFYRDLVAGKIPDHLRPLPTPENLNGFLVFRVVR